MKSINDCINESILQELAFDGLLVAALFCIPNGVYFVKQLLSPGKRKAAKELFASMKASEKEKVLNIAADFDIDKWPEVKELIEAIGNDESPETISLKLNNVYRSVNWYDLPKELRDRIRDLESLRRQMNRTEEETKIRWLCSPSEFLSGIGSSSRGSSSSSRRSSAGGFRGFGGRGGFGGGGAGGRF